MRKAEKMEIRYTGEGRYIQGIPARDLSPEEWQRLSEEQRESAVRLGLYAVKDNGNELKSD